MESLASQNDGDAFTICSCCNHPACLIDEMSAPARITLGCKSARGTSNGVDRLSSLPDAMLHHVMSFLPMPEVVRTSILSPRWRYLWTSTPFIHIDYLDFLNDTGDWTEVGRMEKFVDNLLLLRDGTASLDEARIFISHIDSDKSLSWIPHAIKHNARLLHVYGAHRHVRLDSIAMCPSKHLKRIRLESVSLVDGIFAPLNYNFPMLEHLELELCTVWTTAEIISRSLKTLRITRCRFLMDLWICATNLTHLSILYPLCSGAVVTRDLPSLIAASITLSDIFHDGGDTLVDHRIFDGLSHATELELHAPSPELVFERCLQTCPMFSNLTRLVLGDWCMAGGVFYPLFRILHHSPKLKELSVKLKMEHCRTCSEGREAEYAALRLRWAPLIDDYPCIERIKIYCSKDDPRVGRLVQALLPIFIPDGKISIEGC